MAKNKYSTIKIPKKMLKKLHKKKGKRDKSLADLISRKILKRKK